MIRKASTSAHHDTFLRYGTMTRTSQHDLASMQLALNTTSMSIWTKIRFGIRPDRVSPS